MVRLVFFGLDEHEQDVTRRAFAGEGGYDVALYAEPLTIENVSLAHGAEGIGVFVMSRVTREVLDRLPDLKMIAAMSTGFDHIDFVACRERKIAVSNVPRYGDTTVAEFAFGLILALARRFRPTFERTDRGDFSRAGLQGMDLAGKTLGLIGTGRIGSHLARIARAAEMEVIAYDLKPNPALTEEYGVRYVDLDDVLRQADVISLHVPYTKATHHLIDAERLRLVKDTVLLVNTSRGGVVDTGAVADALREGHLGGVAFDTFEGEEVWIQEEFQGAGEASEDDLRDALESFGLLHSDKAILTPHNAFNTREAVDRILDASIENIRAFFAGNPQNVVAGTYRVPAEAPAGGGA
ncbi:MULTISPECIES: NAD(P)-dependent oxidoreductase [unclassified Methanoculleus]|uniref:NAD(P)-dependent oxidoreductase n=1 Tax=unclassified Methanoculleus TaxID=2619537 RepID=UPI0025F445F7|nr:MULTISPECIES: NAD(P)-dependent oxidoreductase [unclassified Methanoculleus]MCK9317791.1 NAD(P)-binding domain-containing protein [Methanoculleus sp.]MDD2254943.1 NAD(P)-dependent oxidoreductase [Methanoculleus sp.]MDD2788920.1 NAD(P)-dependent oxidoreductase [Methanoculleus sp.]MDD3216668.1 NAD(P)-dependent oxidoreductase [Methanoculleus sp.]MDD4315008.1 NAD(P)-dependent oxidoreductase [Methanoculleus sp.]